MEYVKFTFPEKIYGKKEILYVEMSVLTILKNYREYIQHREQELRMKVALKRKITQLKNELLAFEKLLPKVKNFEMPKLEAKNIETKRKIDLEQELEEIRRKISNLS